MDLASNSRRDDTWFDVPSPTGSTLIPDQTFASPHPLQDPARIRKQNKVDALLSTPWFGETASDAEEWRALAAERRARLPSPSKPSNVPTLITTLPQTLQVEPVQARPKDRPALMPVGPRVPLWMVALLSSGLLLTSALLLGALVVLSSLLVVVLL
jgi:hypothetical protein